jgi:hypothetical protein
VIGGRGTFLSFLPTLPNTASLFWPGEQMGRVDSMFFIFRTSSCSEAEGWMNNLDLRFEICAVICKAAYIEVHCTKMVNERRP